MLYDTLFLLVFISQIIVISIYYPRKLKNLVMDLDAPSSDNRVGGPRVCSGKTIRVYVLLNHLVVVTGLVVLVLFFTLEAFESMTAVLLAIGIFFFLQLSPLLIPGISDLLSDLNSVPSRHDDQRKTSTDAIQLFDVVSPLLVGVAVILFLAYLIPELLRWGGNWDIQLLKILIFISSNLFFAGVIITNLYSVKRSTDEDYVKRLQDFRKIAPTFVYISIGISIYFFGKQFLFDFDMQHFRPTMMSVFLQLLAFGVFNKRLSHR
jgi:hypothetical protein